MLRLWAILGGLAPSVALACGGLFCSTGPTAAPVDQTAERILFEVGDDGVICTTVEILYSGEPERFAWLVPLPAAPAVSEVDPALLDAVAAAAGLAWLYPADPGGCFVEDDSGGCNNDVSDEGGGSFDGQAPEIWPNDVRVVARQRTERYDTFTLAAEAAADVVEWLQANEFNVSANMIPAMQPYLDEGQLFLAVRLRTDREARRVTPLRLCYAAEAPSIPLRLTAVAAQPQLGVRVFIAARTLYGPLAATALPDPRSLAFDVGGRVNYPAWVARRVAQSGGSFWSLEWAGPMPRIAYEPGAPCEWGGDCAEGEACTYGLGETGTCQRTCTGDADCPSGACTRTGETRTDLVDACQPATTAVGDPGQWLTTWYTRLSPEHMTEDPIFVRSPELPAFDGVVDLTARASITDCGVPVDARRPSSCAFVYCGVDTQCVDFGDGSTGCLCGNDVGIAIDSPAGPQVVCTPAVNPLGVTPEDGGDPCRAHDCGTGECVARGGFPTCRCGDDVAYLDRGAVSCRARPRGAVLYDEGAGPDAGNRDQAPANRARRGLGAGLLVLGLLGWFVHSRRR